MIRSYRIASVPADGIGPEVIDAGLEVLELPVHEHLPWGILAAPPGLAAPLLELVEGP